jgi:flagellar basal-body rod protein FlgF
LLRGIYSSASGMLMEMDKVFMHASNISNAQSLGFKRREMAAVPFKELIINAFTGVDEKKIGSRRYNKLAVPVGTGAGAAYQLMDNSQGSFRPTDNPLDIALQGNGWLTLQKQDGSFYTTKNGSFLVNKEGEIVNSEGHKLMGSDNKVLMVSVPKTADPNNPQTLAKSLKERLIITEDGTLVDDGKEVGKLKIQTDIDNLFAVNDIKLLVHQQQDAQRQNGRIFSNKVVNPNATKPEEKFEEIRVQQGFLENSNVQIITEMIGLIHASKNYESGHKLITSEDKILDKAINELGRTG